MRVGLILGGVVLLPVGAPAHAEMTRSFTVSASVVNGCSVNADATQGWGRIDMGTTPGTAGARAEGSLVSAGGAGIAVECTPGVTATLSADGGDNAAGGARRLRQSGGSATIAYQLFADGSSSEWAASPVSLPFAPGSGQRLVPIRAVATLVGAQPAGTYTDTVRITLTW